MESHKNLLLSSVMTVAALLYLSSLAPTIDATSTKIIRERPPRISKTKLDITNKLQGQENLQIHCKDANFDYGVVQIPYDQTHRDYLQFLGGNPDVYCGFVFNDVLHWFDIYLGSRDRQECGSNFFCRWIVKEEGPCKVDPSQPDGVGPCYPWNEN